MDLVWPSVLINGGVVLFLWGLVWRASHQRTEEVKQSVTGKVDREFCLLQHNALREDIQEIRRNQERMATALDDIRVTLARESGRKGKG